MKKVIFGALLVASIGTLSAFTSKTDTAVASKTQLGTADAMKAKVAHDKTQLGTAD